MASRGCFANYTMHAFCLKSLLSIRYIFSHPGCDDGDGVLAFGVLAGLLLRLGQDGLFFGSGSDGRPAGSLFVP